MKTSFLILLLLCGNVWADDNKLADAIYKAEGGKKAVKPYGILSVTCNSKAECRQICLNTIRNQRKRHKAHDCGLGYLECLARRYAPIGVKNDPSNLNKNWLKNVRYFYRRLTNDK